MNSPWFRFLTQGKLHKVTYGVFCRCSITSLSPFFLRKHGIELRMEVEHELREEDDMGLNSVKQVMVEEKEGGGMEWDVKQGRETGEMV